MIVRVHPVDAERLPRDIRSAAEAFAPELIADQDHRIGAGPIVASRNPRPRIGWTPTASNAATVSSPPLNRSGRPSAFDRFKAAKPNAPIFSNEVCRFLEHRQVLDADGLQRLPLRRVGRDERRRYGRRRETAAP